MEEIWKDIEEYKGIYEVSNLGNVRRIEYFDKKHYKWRKRTIKGRLNSKGYLQVSLSKNGKVKNEYIHRLVAHAFIQNPNKLPQINHIDGNKQNNNADNLEWYTCKDNIKHAVDNGLFIITKRKVASE